MVQSIISLENEVRSKDTGKITASSQPVQSPAKIAGSPGEIAEFIDRLVKDGVYSGVVLFASKDGRREVGIVNGQRIPVATNAALFADTVFDIGTATGTLVTTMLLMRLFEQGRFRLEDRVSRFLQGMGIAGKSSTTMAHLLAHTAGLSQSLPLYEELVRLNSGPRMGMLASSGAKQHVYAQILKAPLRYEPGTRHMPTELGYILLGQICENISALPLDRAFQKLIAQPLALKSSSFIDLSLIKQRGYQPATELFAATGECPKRNRMMCGELSDPTAWAMGGVSGHAGLFSIAADLEKIAAEMNDAYRGQGKIFTRPTLEAFWKPRTTLPAAQESEPTKLGWETPSQENGLAEVGFSKTACGVFGDTGCGVWIDPERSLSFVLLTTPANASGHSKRSDAARADIIGRVMNRFR